MKSPHRVKKIKKIKRIRKWKKRSLFILCFFIFLISFLSVLIYTSLGVTITTTILEKVMPEVKIQKISGSLSDLELEGFSIDIDGMNAKVGKAELSLSGLCLIKGKICIKNFVAENVQVNIDTSASPDDIQSEELLNSKRTIIKAPLAIELRQVTLANVEVNVDDMQFGLSSFSGKATWVNEKIFVSPSNATGVKAIFPDVINSEAKPESNKDTESINQVLSGIFNKPLLSSLPTVNIPVDVYVSSLTGDNWLLHLSGEDYRFNNIMIEAATENNKVNVKLLQAQSQTPYINSDFSIIGNIILGDKWPVTADINLKTTESNEEASTEIIGNINGQILGLLSTTMKISGFNQIDINANIDLAETYMPITAKIVGTSIQWPISGKADYKLNNFNVDLSGSFKNYLLEAKGDFHGDGLPTVLFNMQTAGTNELIDIKQLSAKLPQGELSLSGKIGWLNELTWNALVNFNKIDLSKYIPTYPIKLNGKIETDGSFSETSWAANLNNVQLNGTINKVPLQANGSLTIDSNQFISANKFNFNWGNNRINLNGSTQKDSLVANLNLSNLEVIQAKLKGDITGNVIVHGSINQPIIKSNLTVSNFAWQDILLQHAQLNGNIEYRELLSGNIEIKAKHFEMPNIVIDDAKILFSGDENNHKLTINSLGEPLSTAIHLEGNLNKDRTLWKGSLSEATLAFGEQNRWKINKPVLFQYGLDKHEGSISGYCWVNGPSQLCLDKNVIIADHGEASVSLSKIDLKLFEILNQGDTKITGIIHGNANIKWSSQQNIPSIVAKIESKDVYVTQKIASQTLPIPFDQFSINANINDNQAKLDWKFGLKNFGRVTGNINVSDPVNKKTLTGNFVVDKLSLSIINPLLNSDEHAKGVINGNLKFSGTLLDPYINGNLGLDRSEIKTMQLPADIESVMMNINFKGKSSVLNGQLQTKAGIVDIKGAADWKNIQHWNAFVTVKGAAIEVSLPPMINMSVVPDIRVEANQDQLDLTGKIEIPTAIIKVESLPPSTIDVSSDEVMLDDKLQEIEPQNLGMKINTKVFVSLGDKVTVDAFGLIAQLKGGVFVTQTTKGLTVNGQINIPKGRFQAYGQDLIVRKGEIVFMGPAEQPRLNIEAIRNPESIENNVIAGIRVTGLADDPKAEVFSEPAMSQQEALSYLLRGQGLESGDQSENDMMTALLIGLGTAQGGKIIGSIGDTFGIKNLSLDTQGAGNSQKVVVSGYILPHLQLKYGIGIFDSLATFTLRYRLLPRLYLEAVTGVDQTVDLIYQFEF